MELGGCIVSRACANFAHNWLGAFSLLFTQLICNVAKPTRSSSSTHAAEPLIKNSLQPHTKIKTFSATKGQTFSKMPLCFGSCYKIMKFNFRCRQTALLDGPTHCHSANIFLIMPFIFKYIFLTLAKRKLEIYQYEFLITYFSMFQSTAKINLHQRGSFPNFDKRRSIFRNFVAKTFLLAGLFFKNISALL